MLAFCLVRDPCSITPQDKLHPLVSSHESPLRLRNRLEFMLHPAQPT